MKFAFTNLTGLFALLLVCSGTVCGQNTIGIFFRHEQSPETNEKLPAYETLIEQINGLTQGDYTISEPFAQAHRTELTWIKEISLADPGHYPEVLLLLT